jgi:hypothetical protein
MTSHVTASEMIWRRSFPRHVFNIPFGCTVITCVVWLLMSHCFLWFPAAPGTLLSSHNDIESFRCRVGKTTDNWTATKYEYTGTVFVFDLQSPNLICVWTFNLTVSINNFVRFWRWCISIKRIVFLDFIHRLVSQEQTKLKKLKIIDKRAQYTRPQRNHTRINYKSQNNLPGRTHT